MKGMLVLLEMIAFIGATLAIALNDFRGDLDRESRSVTNETQTFVVGTPKTMNNDFINSITAVVNNSAHTLASTQYSLVDSGTATSRINITNTSRSGGLYNVSYSFNVRDDAFNISSVGLKGTKNATSYLGTTGTIMGIAVLIGIVMISFYFMRR